MNRREKQIIISENTLTFGIRDSLKISESRRDHIINYIKMASKGP
jgi:hypothetical protein